MDSKSRLICWISVIILGGIAASATAEIPGPAMRNGPINIAVQEGATPKFGPASLHYVPVSAFSFQGYSASDCASMEGIEDYRYCSSECNLMAPVEFPNGVTVSWVDIFLYDANESASVVCYFFECPSNESCDTIIAFLTGVAWDGGITWFALPIDPALTIDNVSNTYLVECTIEGGTDATRIRFIKFRYRYQVSPAPASATFLDVPVGAFGFQHIEALVASGITAGCGGGNFCPDASLTRAQMAVFLAKALGLHWYP